MRVIDLVWVIEPNANFTGPQINLNILLDLAAALGLGGIWVAMFARQLQNRPLMAFNDPQMESVLEQAHEHHDEGFIEAAK